MATAVRGRTRRGGGMSTVEINDFSGGLNLRDAPSELAANETPDCWNVTLDTRGGVVKRLGTVRLNSSPITSPASYIYYWPTEQLTIIQMGANLYKTADFVTFTLIKAFSTSAVVGCVDFQGKMFIIHPADGLWAYTSAGGIVQTAGGTNNMEAVKGNCLAVWQNMLWASGDPAKPARVLWSKIGDGSSWSGTAEAASS